MLHATGIPLATKMVKAVAGYDLYKGVQMPFGRSSADFGCSTSETSKNVCELPGDFAVDSCSAIHLLSEYLPSVFINRRTERSGNCLHTPKSLYP